MNNQREENMRKHKTFIQKYAILCKSAGVFSMFCVGRGSTVNNDVLAAQRKHEKTLCVKKIKALFYKIVSVLSMFHAWCRITVNTDT